MIRTLFLLIAVFSQSTYAEQPEPTMMPPELSVNVYSYIPNIHSVLKLDEYRVVLADETTGEEHIAVAEHPVQGKYRSMILKNFHPTQDHKYRIYIYKYYFLGTSRPTEPSHLLCSGMLDSKIITQIYSDMITDHKANHPNSPFPPMGYLHIELGLDTLVNGNQECQFETKITTPNPRVLQ